LAGLAHGSEAVAVFEICQVESIQALALLPDGSVDPAQNLDLKKWVVVRIGLAVPGWLELNWRALVNCAQKTGSEKRKELFSSDSQ
jgi:hypothetical protein